MADKVVYVHPTHESDTVNIITPKAYDALLEQGWEIVETRSKRVDGKSVEQVRLRRREDNRGVTTRRGSSGDDDEQDGSSGRGLSVLGETAARGGLVPRGVAVGGGSFLGGGSDFAGLPGIVAAGSVVIQHAFSMGTDAANTGQTEAACPWPPGTPGATQWLRGFRAASKAATTGGDPTGGPTHEAYEAGRAAGKGDDDLEVHCPYPEGTPHYTEWLRGFKEAGGRIA